MTRMEYLMNRLTEMAKNVAFAERAGFEYDKEEVKEDLSNLVEKIEAELAKKNEVAV